MKKTLLFTLVIFLFFEGQSFSQVSYNHKIDSIVNLVSLPSIVKMDRELSGDTIAMIGGVPQLIFSRYWSSPGNVRAEQYIYEKFQSFGYNPKYMVTGTTNKNIYVEKIGTKYPNRKFVICAHFDNSRMPTPSSNDTLPGADDNGSGVVALLEVSRVIKNINLDYTVILVSFDEEEVGYHGSKAFVDSCYFRGDTLVGAMNINSIGYDGNSDNVIDVLPNPIGNNLYYDFYNSNLVYQIGLNVIFNIYPQNMGDHHSFWDRNYKAILQFEHFPDYNPYNHTVQDKFDKFNLPYFLKNVKAAVALTLSWGLDQCANIFHNPLTSTSDTTSRSLTFEVHYPIPIATGSNAPRLYYKLNNGSYNYVNPISHSGYFYNFILPGYPAGSKISYYFAVQDSTGTYVTTSPLGGSGTNPPGTTPPSTQYVYYIYTSTNYSSNTVPKPINDMQYTFDTIHVPIQGILSDIKVILNINHSNDGDIFMILMAPNSSTSLCQFVGEGGQNFTGTIFDDTASKSISQGTPPFTGRFRPSGSLSNFNGQQIYGDWILKIYDSKTGNQGTLLNWNIQIKYTNSIGIKEINSFAKDYKLYQNYPNPFNPNTTIQFDIKDARFTILKIYDMLGKEVKVLVNEILSQGSYKVDFNGSELSSGVYFYSLETSDPEGNEKIFREVKRMVLVK
jgi:subtilisin-like proprotein convertase family protein